MSRRHVVAPPRRAADESMTLINAVYERPLDPGYQEAARRKEAGLAPRRTLTATSGLLALALVLGAGGTAAAVALRRPVAAVTEARTLLEEQILARGAQVERLSATNAALNAEISALQTEAARSADPGLLAELQQDAVAAGSVPVQGPGLQVVLTDGTVDTQDPDLRVQDVDLQVLVNGLWAAGAEAVSINGARLTSTSAIRSAGAAVLVDLTPLSSPYTVLAVGDGVDLQTGLARTSAGQHLATLQQRYRIGVDVSVRDDLALPASAQVVLRHARPPEVAPATTPAGPTGTGSPSAARLGPAVPDVASSGRPGGQEQR
ncbi:DUF881 domain-containing protein [Cellulomonas sp. SLBN-39]|uniref:DUF881 domain-containing protein n=1 Tax=Cellulomonas sp. SLBN-39 TaxID=2768446 RepID=UPI0011528B9E|nr:DUF881 domain-containing protein [Cellulomonas sp. SLBN-39]TQL04135.1 uncharacterized protein YlxW (UPF0749 family) [Cellulomonas sp. SLBN-39]